MWLSKLSWFTPWRAGLVIFLLAFFVRLAIYVLLLGPHPIPPDTELGRIAVELGLNHQFANPYKAPTGPTAHAAPLYPFIQSAWVAVFGNTLQAGIAAALLNIVFSALASALLPVLASQCGISVLVGVFAGLFQALLPVSAFQELSFFEATLVALLLVVAAVFTIRIFTNHSFSFPHAIAYGLFWGILLLASPTTALVFCGFLLVGLRFNWSNQRRAYLRFAVAAAFVAALCLIPWTIRNARTLGALFFVRDDFGLELKISNNDDASPLMDANLTRPFFIRMHPSDSVEESNLVAVEGEVAYNRRALRSAIAWIRTHPTQFLSLTIRRFFLFWFMLGWPPWKGLVLIPMALLALFGLVRMIRRHPIAGWVLAVIPVLFPPVYYIVQTSSRYRFPAFWTIPFLACYAIAAYLGRKESSERRI